MSMIGSLILARWSGDQRDQSGNGEIRTGPVRTAQDQRETHKTSEIRTGPARTGLIVTQQSRRIVPDSPFFSQMEDDFPCQIWKMPRKPVDDLYQNMV